MSTAPDAYRSLLRDHVAPALRELGLVGSGGTYRIRSADDIGLVGFQRSRHDDGERVAFTVNLTATTAATWRAARAAFPWLPERPAASTRYPGGLWQARLGSVMPGGADRWWQLTAETDLPAMAAEVVEAIREHGLPALQEHLAEV